MPDTRSLPVRSSLIACLSGLLMAGCGSPPPEAPVAEAAVPAAPAALGTPPSVRPPTVPDDYVATPNGFFHRSCVIELAQDETIGADHKIHRADGRTRDITPCDHPRYDRAGHVIPTGGAAATGAGRAATTGSAPGHTPSTDGWVEAAGNADNGPLNWVAGNFTVPSNPAMASSQLLYYFPGLQPTVTGTEFTIMQPVLQYWAGQWSAASWNCCVDGVTAHSPEIAVNPGDTLYGYIQGNNCDGSGFCTDWQVYTGDWSTGGSTTLNTNSYGSVMGWAFGGVLEAYGIDDCAEYPTSGGISFTNLQVRNAKYLSVYPVWSTDAPTDKVPNCPYSISSPDTSTVILSTGSTSAPSPATPASCGIIEKGEGLRAGQSLSSCDGRFALTLQPDGNLVLIQGTTTLWASNTTGASAAEMMSGGEFALWSATSQRVWSTGTGWADSHLALQDDGNVVIYNSDGLSVWATNTCCH